MRVLRLCDLLGRLVELLLLLGVAGLGLQDFVLIRGLGNLFFLFWHLVAEANVVVRSTANFERSAVLKS